MHHTCPRATLSLAVLSRAQPGVPGEPRPSCHFDTEPAGESRLSWSVASPLPPDSSQLLIILGRFFCCPAYIKALTYHKGFAVLSGTKLIDFIYVSATIPKEGLFQNTSGIHVGISPAAKKRPAQEGSRQTRGCFLSNICLVRQQ